MAALISASEWGRVRARRRGQEPLEQVGARDDADDGLSPQHRQPLDAMADHPIDRLAELRVLGDRLDVAGHHLADLAPVLMRVGLGEPSAAEQEFEPMGALALASKLAAAKKVAFAQDPDQRVVGVEDEQRAHPRSQHRLDRLREARVLGHADHAIGHHVPNPHSLVPRLMAAPGNGLDGRGQ